MPTGEPASDAVDLTGLEVIRRYSLAVRQATANREELVAVLNADLQRLRGGASRPSPTAKKAGRRTAADRA